MKLIIGLGNKGTKYDNTWHNVGFYFLDNYAIYKNISFDKTKFNAMYTEFYNNSEKIILIKPLSYVNLSGEVVKKYVDYYQIPLENIMVVQDDFDMVLSKIKLKKGGTYGGHNGILSIENNLQSNDFLRLKIGISTKREKDPLNYVLDNINKEELEILNNIIPRINNIIDEFVNNKNIYDIMCRYNGANNGNI